MMRLLMYRALVRRTAPDVVRLMLYRPEFFGRRYSLLLHEALRGPSDWSVGERELMAAFVSKLNQCLF
jgi:hypothetical protein